MKNSPDSHDMKYDGTKQENQIKSGGYMNEFH